MVIFGSLRAQEWDPFCIWASGCFFFYGRVARTTLATFVEHFLFHVGAAFLLGTMLGSLSALFPKYVRFACLFCCTSVLFFVGIVLIFLVVNFLVSMFFRLRRGLRLRCRRGRRPHELQEDKYLIGLDGWGGWPDCAAWLAKSKAQCSRKGFAEKTQIHAS